MDIKTVKKQNGLNFKRIAQENTSKNSPRIKTGENNSLDTFGQN